MRTRFYKKRVICSLPMESGQPHGNSNSVRINKWYMERERWGNKSGDGETYWVERKEKEE